MKEFTELQEQERGKKGQDIFWIAEFDFPPPTNTVFLYTRDLTIQGRTYRGIITKFPDLSKMLPSAIDAVGVVDAAKIQIQNRPEDPDRFESYTLKHTFEGVEVRLGFVFKDQLGSITLADINYAHVYCVDHYEVDTRQMMVNLVDLLLARGEREIGRIITPERFPRAPDGSCGRMMPIIWGRCRDCALIPIDIGGETQLYGSITATETIIKVESLEDFRSPEPGAWSKIQIGDEIIHYNYIDRTTNEIGSLSSPCKRGQDDTGAREHSDRSKVREIRSTYDYIIADHRCKQISNVRVEGRLFENYTTSWRRIDGKDVQVLRIHGQPTYVDISPVSTFLTVSGEKDKDGQSVWLWEVGTNNTATDAANAFNVEGIFSFATIDKDHPALHIEMKNNLSDGISQHGELINVRLGIEYAESQPHDEAKPPYVQLKKDGAYQKLHENVHAYLNLKRASKQETEADNPDHPHEDDLEISNMAPPTTTLRAKAVLFGQEEGETGIRIKSWPGGDSVLYGLDSFSLSYSLPYYQYWPGMEQQIYSAIARHLYALWFEFPDVPYTNEQATIKKITVKVTAGQAPYPLTSFSKRGFRIIERVVGDTSNGPNAFERGTVVANIAGTIAPISELWSLKPGEPTDAEARSKAQTFTFNMGIPANGWDYFKNTQWGMHTNGHECPMLADIYVLDSFVYRVYNIEVEIIYELIDKPYLTGGVLPYRNLIGEISSNRAVQEINITRCVEANGGWGFFNGTTEVLVNFNSTGSGVKIYILNVFFEFEYRARTVKIGTGDVTADVEGIHSGETLYENAASVILALMQRTDHMGFDGSYIDMDSFIQAHDKLAALGYKYARRISSRFQIRELLAEAVWQARCRLFLEGLKYRLKFRTVGSAVGFHSPSDSVFTLDEGYILNPILTKSRSSTVQIANQITINYDESNKGNGFLRSLEKSDEESKELSWGLRPFELNATWHAHRNSTVVTDLADFLLRLMSWKHTMVGVETPLVCSRLERGDIVTLDHPQSEISQMPGEIVETCRISASRLRFIIDTVAVHAFVYWYDKDNYILVTPGRTVMHFVVNGELLGTLDWRGNFRIKADMKTDVGFEPVSETDPVYYDPVFSQLRFTILDGANAGIAFRFYGKNSPTFPRRFTSAYDVKDTHPLSSQISDFIVHTQDHIRIAVNAKDVVMECVKHTPSEDGKLYFKGEVRTHAL